MKHLITLLMSIILVAVLSSPASAQILWRGAKTMKQGSVIGMASWYMMDFTKSYNWTDEEWKEYPSGRSQTFWGFNTMFGYGVTDRLEVHLHLPIAFKSMEVAGVENSSSGIEDIFLKARYAVLPWAKDKHGLTMTGALRFGTGDDEASPALGDGTIDFALGAIFSTAWMNKSRGHLKANYWVNGENDKDVNIGDELKVIVKYDHKLSPKVMPFLTYIYYSQTKKETAAGVVSNSQKIRHYMVLGGVWKPRKGISIRPKVMIPVGGEGGSLFNFKPVLDFWYVFKL